MDADIPRTQIKPVTAEDYEALAAFRRALRRFLAFSEDAARTSGLTAQHHQAILAIKGHPGGGPISVGDLADHLLIRHNSAVELIDRLVRANLVVRSETAEDRRRVALSLTPRAETILAQLSAAHLEELSHSKELLIKLLARIGAA